MSDSIPKNILVKTNVAHDIILRIDREITDVNDFADELQILMAAREEDNVRIELITPGGNVYTAHMLIRAIRECKAKTTAYIGPMCASAGTVIALACDEWEVDEMSSFMLHDGSYGSYGKSGEVAAMVVHTTKMLHRWLRNAYAGFLSEDEIERLLDGRDYWFEGEELIARLTAYSEFRQTRLQEEVKQLKAAVAEAEARLNTAKGGVIDISLDADGSESLEALSIKVAEILEQAEAAERAKGK